MVKVKGRVLAIKNEERQYMDKMTGKPAILKMTHFVIADEDGDTIQVKFGERCKSEFRDIKKNDMVEIPLYDLTLPKGSLIPVARAV